MPHANKDSAAYRLRQVIDWLKMSKNDFCQYMGINSSRLSGWTDGTYLPPVEYMLKLKALKSVSLDWIYAGDGSGQGQTVTLELEAIVPTPLRLKPRKRPVSDIAAAKTKRRKAG